MVGGMAVTAYHNPLADGDDNDVEAGNGVDSGRKLMPPMPHVTIGRMLRRAAERIGASTITRAQVRVCVWGGGGGGGISL
jgi:hypothetical protein